MKRSCYACLISFVFVGLVSCGGSPINSAHTPVVATKDSAKVLELLPKGKSIGLEKTNVPGDVVVETINGNTFDQAHVKTIPYGRDVVLSGWAVDLSSRQCASGVDVVIAGKPYNASKYGLERSDVARYLKHDAYKKSGFQFTIPAGGLSYGSHEIIMRVLSPDGKRFGEGGKISIRIE